MEPLVELSCTAYSHITLGMVFLGMLFNNLQEQEWKQGDKEEACDSPGERWGWFEVERGSTDGNRKSEVEPEDL